MKSITLILLFICINIEIGTAQGNQEFGKLECIEMSNGKVYSYYLSDGLFDCGTDCTDCSNPILDFNSVDSKLTYTDLAGNKVLVTRRKVVFEDGGEEFNFSLVIKIELVDEGVNTVISGTTDICSCPGGGRTRPTDFQVEHPGGQQMFDATRKGRSIKFVNGNVSFICSCPGGGRDPITPEKLQQYPYTYQHQDKKVIFINDHSYLVVKQNVQTMIAPDFIEEKPARDLKRFNKDIQKIGSMNAKAQRRR